MSGIEPFASYQCRRPFKHSGCRGRIPVLKNPTPNRKTFEHYAMYAKHEGHIIVDIFADEIAKGVIRVLIFLPLCSRKVCKVLPLNRMASHIKPGLPVT